MNRVTLVGKLLSPAKIRSFEARGGTVEIVSLWIEVAGAHRADRFSVDINCPKAASIAKAMPAGVLAEIAGVLRRDSWKDKETGAWINKVYVAIDPGEGVLRSKGPAEPQGAVQDAAA